MRRVRALVSVLTLLVGLLVVTPSAARADDPVFDPGPIAASPGCRGRSGASQEIDNENYRTVFGWEYQVWQALSECDTQNLIQQLQRNALLTGGCSLAFKAIGLAPPAKLPATVGDVICTSATLAQGGFALALAQADQNGGGCGVIIKYRVTYVVDMVGNTGGSLTVNGLQILSRPCPNGVAPKADLGSQIVAGTGAGEINWYDYDYDGLPDLGAPTTDPVVLADYSQPGWAAVPPTEVTAAHCAPITVPAPSVTGDGAAGYAVSGVGNLDQLQHGTVDASSGPDAVTYTPDGSGNGTDVITFSYDGPTQLSSSVTVRVTGCAKLWIQFGLGGNCVQDCDDPHYDTMMPLTMNVRMTNTLTNSVYLTGNPWGGREEGNLQVDAPDWNIRHVTVSDGTIRDTECTITYGEDGAPVEVTYRYVYHDGSHVRATDWITTNQVI
ncbi:hypothetical protein [Micromonospora mirobrigensis]|uniref:Uncharacterized protein n=1 Tax=Micromonospora mirobrigensis TaxID=262898 RepID=A0A1C4Z3B7_9ACTN|nr:hypothetical protein [Micromonospora mirobrigensis]SCF27406.1 hypothetical protein GA0070564_10528 [Micromonospora mirobrigensis]